MGLTGVYLSEINFENLRDKMLNEVKGEIKKGYSNEEYTLIQAINAYDETLRSYNLFSERLTEWFSLYYPSLKVSSPFLLSQLIPIIGKNESLDLDKINSVVNDIGKSNSIIQSLKDNIGKDINDNELRVASDYAELVYETYNTLLKVKKYIDYTANILLPNTVYLTDSLIASELLNKAGSLERLSIMPSSTIQLLGAENALFKHIKFGSKPPKYGLIFKMPKVNTARKDLRGRIARVYANKITIALKADVYTKNFIADKLKDDLDESISKILSSPKKSKPPAKSNNYNNSRNNNHNNYGRNKSFNSGRPKNFGHGRSVGKDNRKRNFKPKG